MATIAAALRIYQWPKNLVVFAALLFGGQLLEPAQVLRSLLAFLVMCLASSGIYLVNDVIDAPRDRLHPVKRLRPVARGDIAPRTALLGAGLLLFGSLGEAFLVRPAFGGTVVLYVALMLAYTFQLKHVFLVDVLVLASGFVIRAVAGAVVLDVEFTNWLVVCTFFLALFLGLCKRRREVDLGGNVRDLREVFAQYTPGFLDRLTMLAAGGALFNYVIYTCSTPVFERFGTDKLYLTVPFVVYGLFRYLFLVHHKTGGEDPSRTLLDDGPLMAAIAAWALACAVIIYGSPWLGTG